jgi:hypothetical protein
MSGSNVAYHLRVNKYVDRRLLVEALEFVARYQAVRDMGYVSMGGWYLEDFRVMHQSLGIRRMLTFDIDEWVVRRQTVNKPYGFIECEVASSGEILDSFDDIRKRLVGPSGNVIVWLDYTIPSKRYDQLAELEQLTSLLIHGDVFRITLNASRSSFGTNEQYQIKKKAGQTDKSTLPEWWQEKMADQLKDYLAVERDRAELLETEAEFARTLLWAIKKAALNGLHSRAELTVEPLLAVYYSDGQGMVTFAGLVLEADRRNEFLERARWAEWPHAPGQQWDDFVKLDVPNVSLRERQMIHCKMESISWPFAAYLLGFQLDGNLNTHKELVTQYLMHYRRYPTFAPSDIL